MSYVNKNMLSMEDRINESFVDRTVIPMHIPAFDLFQKCAIYCRWHQTNFVSKSAFNKNSEVTFN